jgi:hypothetical protein
MVQTTIVRSPRPAPAPTGIRRHEPPPERESLAGTILMVALSLLIMACIFLGAV